MVFSKTADMSSEKKSLNLMTKVVKFDDESR